MLDPTNDGTDTQRYHVYLENDNVNMREYVARTLMMVCVPTQNIISLRTGPANEPGPADEPGAAG